MTWIGLELGTQKMVVRVPAEKLTDISGMLNDWRGRKFATRHQLQQILGKLLYVAHVCKPARLFVSRMLEPYETLRAAPLTGTITLEAEFKRDISWFLRFLPKFI